MTTDTTTCSCEHEDVGDAENGPRLSTTPDENCPIHGRVALPDEWALEDDVARGYVLASVYGALGLVLLPHDSVRPLERERERRAEAVKKFGERVDDDLVVKMHAAALAGYVEEDDGFGFDRASWDVARALVALYVGPAKPPAADVLLPLSRDEANTVAEILSDRGSLEWNSASGDKTIAAYLDALVAKILATDGVH